METGNKESWESSIAVQDFDRRPGRTGTFRNTLWVHLPFKLSSKPREALVCQEASIQLIRGGSGRNMYLCNILHFGLATSERTPRMLKIVE